MQPCMLNTYVCVQLIKVINACGRLNQYYYSVYSLHVTYTACSIHNVIQVESEITTTKTDPCLLYIVTQPKTQGAHCY